MITVYEIKRNGYLGSSKQVDPREGVSGEWTYSAPPGEGPHRWERGEWVPCVTEPDGSFPLVDLGRIASDVRKQRDQLLAACDWTQVADAPVDQVAWAEYRQALRDVPSQEGFPMQVVWPVKPGSGS